jgi:alpha-ketoglutarate-dependent taurine dioxygenase
LARPIDDETFAAIERAYNDHGVIFFRDQLITPPQQEAKVVVTTAIAREMVGFIWAIARIAQPAVE